MEIDNTITPEEAFKEINLAFSLARFSGEHSLLFGHMTKTLSLNFVHNYDMDPEIPRGDLNELMDYVKAEHPGFATMVIWLLEAVADQVSGGLEIYALDEGFLLSWSDMVCLVLVEHQGVIELGQETGAITLQ